MSNPASKAAERAVVVFTSYRGVFWGYATDTDGDTIALRSARNCYSWPADNKGFLGLAAVGPLPGAKVGPRADITLRSITCVALCTPEATNRWEAATWSD